MILITFALIAIESKNAGIRRKSFFIIWNFKMLVFKVVIHVFYGRLKLCAAALMASKCGAKVVINSERAGAEGNVLQHMRNVDSFF